MFALTAGPGIGGMWFCSLSGILVHVVLSLRGQRALPIDSRTGGVPRTMQEHSTPVPLNC